MYLTINQCLDISFRYCKSKDNLKHIKAKAHRGNYNFRRCKNTSQRVDRSMSGKPEGLKETTALGLNFQTLSYDYKSFMQGANCDTESCSSFTNPLQPV